VLENDMFMTSQTEVPTIITDTANQKTH